MITPWSSNSTINLYQGAFKRHPFFIFLTFYHFCIKINIIIFKENLWVDSRFRHVERGTPGMTRETNMSKYNFFKKYFPENIFVLAVFLAIFSFVAFYLVDLRNFLGLRDFLFNTKPDYFFFTYHPFFFHHWGRNSGFAELIQWTFLAGSILVSAFLAGSFLDKKKENKNLFYFWLIMSISFVLMLFEDTGDVRHVWMSYVQAIFDEPDQGLFGTIFEFVYFAVLGGLPLYALIKYFKDLKKYKKVKNYILIGFVFYALAGGFSFIGSAFEGIIDKNIYTILGEKFYNFCLVIGDADLKNIWANWNENNWIYQIEFFLMDSLVEEGLEIIGGGAFVTASFLFLKSRIKSEK